MSRKNFIIGIASGLSVLALALTAVVTPISQPTPHPMGQLMSYQGSQAARAAKLKALELQGYELTEPMRMATD